MAFFRASAALLERGHCKRMLESRDGGPVCLSGAVRIGVAGHPRAANSEIADRMDDVAVVLGVGGKSDAVGWNDRAETSREQVVAALDAAAVVALQEEGIEPEDVL